MLRSTARPKVMNAMNIDCVEKITLALEELAKDVTLKVNGNNFEGDELEFTLPNRAGNHEISYYCSDIVENESNEKVKSVIMDTEPPTTSYEYDGPVFTRENRLYISAFTDINLTGLDDASGLRQTHS